MNEPFETFAIVELMGRSVMAGKVSEQVIGGAAFVRIDVPATKDNPAFTKLYGPSAIYCITPCDEATACAAVEGLRQKPLNLYMLNLPAAYAALSDGDSRDE